MITFKESLTLWNLKKFELFSAEFLQRSLENRELTKTLHISTIPNLLKILKNCLINKEKINEMLYLLEDEQNQQFLSIKEMLEKSLHNQDVEIETLHKILMLENLDNL